MDDFYDVLQEQGREVYTAQDSEKRFSTFEETLELTDRDPFPGEPKGHRRATRI